MNQLNAGDSCPLCGEGRLSTHSEEVESEYRDQKTVLPLAFKRCDACGSEFAGANEASQNMRKLLDYRESVDKSLPAWLFAGPLHGNGASAMRATMVPARLAR